jgi:transposase
VTLTPEERQQLLEITHQNNLSARRFKRAQILLLADEGHRDETIAQMLYVGESTVHRTRQKFVAGGVEFALSEAPRSGATVKSMAKQKPF